MFVENTITTFLENLNEQSCCRNPFPMKYLILFLVNGRGNFPYLPRFYPPLNIV